MKPTLAVTIGDPAGIGPEVVLKALARSEIRALAEWKIAGNFSVLASTAAQCGLPPDTLSGLEIVDPAGPALLGTSPVQTGALRAEYGRAAMNYVRVATEMCLAGQADAMVTAPIEQRGGHALRRALLRAYRVHCPTLWGNGIAHAAFKRAALRDPCQHSYSAAQGGRS